MKLLNQLKRMVGNGRISINFSKKGGWDVYAWEEKGRPHYALAALGCARTLTHAIKRCIRELKHK